LYTDVEATVHDAYAGWGAAELVINYMETHEGAWPRRWEDLRGPAHGDVGSIRKLVEIDFGVNPAALPQAEAVDDNAPFRVIWLRDGRRVYWKGQEPNRMIWEYLRAKREKTEKKRGRE
jgi:hypothetical protein